THRAFRQCLAVALVAAAAEPLSDLPVTLNSAGSSSPSYRNTSGVDAEKAIILGVPGILDCAYDEEWNAFRKVFRENAATGFHFN
ncbi:unnamed protein product, partial [Polarella glacialis]